MICNLILKTILREMLMKLKISIGEQLNGFTEQAAEGKAEEPGCVSGEGKIYMGLAA